MVAGASVAEASLVPVRKIARHVLEAAHAFGLDAGIAVASADTMRLHCSLAWTLVDLRAGLSACKAVRHDSVWGVSWRFTNSSECAGADLPPERDGQRNRLALAVPASHL